jgi:hypothetical protein
MSGGFPFNNTNLINILCRLKNICLVPKGDTENKEIEIMG